MDAPVQKKGQKNSSHLERGWVEESLKIYFKNRSEVLLAYLYGSYLGSKVSSFHDIDIAVLVAPRLKEALDREMPYGYRAFLGAEVAHVLKYDSVDIILLNNAPPLLLRRVIGTGKLIFCLSEKERIRFELESLKRHADTAHIRKIKRFYMKQRIEKGLPAYG